MTRHRRRGAFLGLLSLVLAFAAHAETDGPPLSFAEAVDTALAGNADLSAMRRDLDRAQINAEIADAAYASDIELLVYGNTGFSNVTVSQAEDSGLDDQLYVKLRWTFPWWHKSGLKLDAAIARLDIDLARARYHAAEQDLRRQLYESYLGVVLTEEKLRVAESTLRTVEARRDLVAESFELGRASRVSLTGEDSNLRTQQVAVDSLGRKARERRDDFGRLLGLPVPDRRLCADILRLDSYDPEAGRLEDALNDQLADLKIQIAQQTIERAKQEERWSPRLSARLAYSYESDLFDSDNANSDDVRAGILFQLPLPNFAKSSAEERLALHDLSALEEQLQRRATEIRDRDLALRRRIVDLRSELELFAEAMAMKQEEVEAVRQGYELGINTNIELRFVETGAEELSSRYYDVLYDYLSAVADHRRLHGADIGESAACATN